MGLFIFWEPECEDKVYVCVCVEGGVHVYVNACASCVCGCVHMPAHVCIFRFHQGHPRIESETRQLRVERAPGPQRPLQDPTTPAPSHWHCHLLFSPCPLSAPWLPASVPGLSHTWSWCRCQSFYPRDPKGWRIPSEPDGALVRKATLPLSCNSSIRWDNWL